MLKLDTKEREVSTSEEYIYYMYCTLKQLTRLEIRFDSGKSTGAGEPCLRSLPYFR